MARWKFILARAAKAYGKDKCSAFAAAIAYYALLSIFPLTVFAVTIGGYALRNDPGAQERMIDALLEHLPLDEQSGRADLEGALAAVTAGRAGLGLLGLAGVAYSASALFGAMRTALNVVFRVERSRPLVQGKLLDLGMVLGLGLLVLASLVITGAIALLQRFSQQIFGDFSVLADVLFGLAYFIFPLAASLPIFLIAYKVVPHADLSWRHALPGAVLAAAGWEVLKIGFSRYIANFGNYDAVYGTLGFVIVFLFFAYLSAQIVLFGAEFSRAYAEVASGAVPAVKPAVPKRPMSVAERAEAVVKGLFVADGPHHEERLPYHPAQESGPLTDRQAGTRD